MDEERTEKLDDKRLIATAYHEAGHAVIAIALGRPVNKVTIVPGKSDQGMQRLGVCHIKNGRSKPTKDWLEDEAMILFAGMVAEAQFTGKYELGGASYDLERIRYFAQMRADGAKQIDRLERRWLSKTEHYLSDPLIWKAVQFIADELLRIETVSGRAALHFYKMAQSEKD